MRIGLDVMGGDKAPHAILDGAIAAAEHLAPDDELVLFGCRKTIESALLAAGLDRDCRFSIEATSNEIGMEESPVEAVRAKPESALASMARAAGRRAENRLDAMISAGNTGACVTAAQMYMRRLPHVHRPGIAVAVPTFTGQVVLIDVGANIEPKAHHLAQYGVMGDVFARSVLGIERPRVAVMNVGGEEQKGTDEMRQARDLLRSDERLDFIGFVEGRSVFDGAADVVITDGVVGNVMIKLAEGLSAGLFKLITREVARIDPELGERFKPIVRSIYAKHDYHEYGGAPLLGVNGICLISHGSSEARTIRNAVRTVRQLVHAEVNQAISDRLGAMEARVG
ncbi:MAG: phosphate acyltransferase PlsX [Phycisphaerales bacterium]